MRKIYSDYWHRQYAIRLLMVLLLMLLVADPSMIGGPPPDQVVRLSLEGARPMAKAVEALERRYGWRITYEDAPIVHASEVVDKTSPAYRNSPTRMLLPIGGRIDLTFYFSDKLAEPDPVALIQSLMENHKALGNAGRFRLEQGNEAFHVIPAQVKNADGNWAAVTPILDVKISLPVEERSGHQTLNAICDALGKSAGVRIILGTTPINLMIRHRGRIGATNETARNVLLRALNDTGVKLSWQLFWDSGLQTYGLNIHPVMVEEKHRLGPKVRRPVP